AVNIAAMLDAAMAAIGVYEPAQSVFAADDLRELTRDARGHVRTMYVVNRRGLGDLFVAVLAAVKMGYHPPRHFVHAGIDRTGWTNVGDRAERQFLDLVPALAVRLREIAVLLRIVDREVRALHPERVEHAVAHRVFPRFARDDLSQVTGSQEHQIVVL